MKNGNLFLNKRTDPKAVERPGAVLKDDTSSGEDNQVDVDEERRVDHGHSGDQSKVRMVSEW